MLGPCAVPTSNYVVAYEEFASNHIYTRSLARSSVGEYSARPQADYQSIILETVDINLILH